LYVAIPSYKCVVIVDSNTHAITGNISTSFFPLSVRLDGNGFMYVSGTSADAGWVFSIDMRNWRVKNSVSVSWGDMVIEISTDGSTLLAMMMGSSPVKIYKYGINSGVFTYLDVDNHDLGSNLQGEKVDWTRGRIYLASGGAYGVELVSTDTLDRLGFWPMAAYPRCIALSSDGNFVFGAHDDWYERRIWLFNATDGHLLGSVYVNRTIEHLAISTDLRTAFIGPPISNVSLAPVIEQLYPAPGALLGYSPTFFTMRFGPGVQDIDASNATAAIDSLPLALSQYDMDGYWSYYRADYSQILAEGIHYINISLPWIDGVAWKNATFTIDRDSPLAIAPTLYPNEPASESIHTTIPLVMSASVVYRNSDFVVQGGWMYLDGINITTVFADESLTAYLNDSMSIGRHNISAYAYWDGGLGKTWANWSFIVMEGPVMTPIYPADGQVLEELPDHLEVAIDYRDTGGNVSSAQLYIDYEPILTTMTPNGTMRASIDGMLKTGNHTGRATLNWVGGMASVTWWFTVDVFVGPNDELLSRYQYKDEFSLPVPHGIDWKVAEDSDISGVVYPLVISGPTFTSFMTNIIVTSQKDSRVEETEAYLDDQLDQAIADLEDSGMTALMVGTPELRTVDNHTALVATIQLEGYSVYQKIALIASEDHQMMWVIIFSINLSQYSAYNDMFEDMINGFEIEMKPVKLTESLGQAVIGIGIAALAAAISGTLVWITRKKRLT
jgi:hypothetical protein